MKIAVIGAGVMGRNHIRVIQTIPGAELVAVCDPQANGDYPCPVYTNEIELLAAHTDLDGAIIASPTSTHYAIALAFIEKGVSLLIEKPVAASISEGKAILKAAETNNVGVLIGHIERFNPVIRTLKDELSERTIYSINITRVGPFPARISDVGILTDLSVHDIDLVRYLTGKDVTEAHFMTGQRLHATQEDNANISFRLEDDILVNITTNWHTPYRKRIIEVATQKGYFEADLMAQELKEFGDSHGNSFSTRGCFVRKGDALLLEHTQFINFLQTGDKGDFAEISDSLRTLELISGAVG
ncbi:Gfo/Idh/MocA family oxidoreductase [bacterium]|jgi:UDP-N-acetylglucosamine 3-dehydrogenase|nr:Gfo/Idh/MocA family oxidoreductase [bacterium]